MTTRKPFRDHHGQRISWKSGPENIPTPEQREAAKTALAPYEESISAYCPCCERHFFLASAYKSVAEHGVCNLCIFYVRGIEDGAAVYRDPTVEEVLEIDSDDLRPAEIRVLRNKCLELMGRVGK